MTMNVATKLYTSFVDYVRNNFDQHESATTENKRYAEYKAKSKRIRIRSTSITFLKGRQKIYSCDKEKFKLNTFIPIIDTLYAHLKNRSTAYQEIEKKFSFLFQLISIGPDQMTKKCKEFAEIYHEDINGQELKFECFHLRQYLKNILKEIEDLSILALHKLIKSHQIPFLNVYNL